MKMIRKENLSRLNDVALVIKKIAKHLQRNFKSDYVTYWINLSRLAIMLIIGNFSLFFLLSSSHAIAKYYTHLSLGILFIVNVGLICRWGCWIGFGSIVCVCCLNILRYIFSWQASGIGL